jgi:Recombinase
MRIVQLRASGLSYAQICNVLNAEQVPTPMGRSRWLKSHVDRLLHTQHVRDLVMEAGARRSSIPWANSFSVDVALRWLPARSVKTIDAHAE